MGPSRAGCGKVSRMNRSVALSRVGAVTPRRSNWPRVASRSWPNGTPEGQAVSQARQPRQRSRWRAMVGVSPIRSSAAARMR